MMNDLFSLIIVTASIIILGLLMFSVMCELSNIIHNKDNDDES